MNILKRTEIKGEIFMEYAFLTVEFWFESSGNAASAEYMFGLPVGALISDMKLVTEGGRLVRTSVVAASHAALALRSEPVAVLRRAAGDWLLSLNIAEGGRCRVILSVYAPLCGDAERRLIIPLARGFGGTEEKSGHKASIELAVRGGAEVTSPTHNPGVEHGERETRVFSGEIAADRDFCIQIYNTQRINFAAAVRGITGGELLCRLYPGTFGGTYKRVLFIYDATGSLRGGAASAAKEFLRTAVEEPGIETAVLAACAKPRMLTHGFCPGAEAEKTILDGLNSSESGGSVSDAIKLAGRYVDEETLAVLICGPELTESNLPYAEGLCCVTFGAYAACGAARYALKCGGKGENIFGGDNIAERTAIVMKKLLGGFNGVSAEADGAAATVIKSAAQAGGVTVYVRYSGTPPRNIKLRCGDKYEVCALDKVALYDSFAPVGLVCAEEKFLRLEEKLCVCLPDEVQAVRREQERIGVMYSALNSETALAASIGGAQDEYMRVVIPNGGIASNSVFDGRVSAFNEVSVSAFADYGELLRRYAGLIIKSMRANGAICADGEICPETARRQTLICILALTAAGIAAKNSLFTEAARNFVGEYTYKGAKFTDNPEIAAGMLETIFGGAEPERVADTPDLIAAARLIAGSGRRL